MGFVFAAGEAAGISNTDVKNVKNYGAIGDGATDDHAAIQAAVDDVSGEYSSTYRGKIFFPPGTYLVSEPITFLLSDGITNIHFEGAGGSSVTGNFNDAIFKRVPIGGPQRGSIEISGLQISNSHATGKGVLLNVCIGAKITCCAITAYIGAETYNSQSATIDSCSFVRQGGVHTEAGSIGIIAGNATTVLNCDVISYDHGIRHQNAGLNIIGGRYEVNNKGIVLGMDGTGGAEQTSGAFISGLSMESNHEAGLFLNACSSVVIAGCAVTANDLTADYGIYINSGDNISFIATTVSGTYDNYGIYIPDNVGSRATFISCSAASWRYPGEGTPYQLIQCANSDNVTFTQLPDNAPMGTISAITDGATTAIGVAVTAGGSTNDYVVCRGASSWIRIA